MGHCPFEELSDLAACLDEIRAWPGVRAPKPGVFDVKRTERCYRATARLMGV